ncbi:MAG: hypothetical protein K8U57_08040 [Planctomycetes bacterium]|nr:hypothetical protein [Planctomycetota bacterium]
MLTVSAQAIGRKKPICDDFTVPPPAGVATGNPVTLRELLGHVVRVEVEAFKTRQAESRLVKVLTAKQIDEGLAGGKVSAGGSPLDQKVDADQAVATALEAFADGMFLVIVDGNEVKELDAVVPLTANTKLMFVRLTLLAGG